MGAVELLRRGVRDHARALAGWCAGIVAYLALVSAIFPSIEGSADFDELVESYPDVLRELFGLDGTDISTGAGFLDAELFSFMLPLLVIVLAIGSGARTLAGEEDAGRLELLLAYPVRRRDAVLWKGAAVAAEVLTACVAGFVALAVLDPLIGLDLSTGRLASAFTGVAALGLLHGWLALGVGAVVPSRVPAIGLSAGLAAAGYLIGGLHELAGWLDPLRFSRRSGGSAPRRCRGGSAGPAWRSWSPPGRPPCSRARCWSSGATSRPPEGRPAQRSSRARSSSNRRSARAIWDLARSTASMFTEIASMPARTSSSA